MLSWYHGSIVALSWNSENDGKTIIDKIWFHQLITWGGSLKMVTLQMLLLCARCLSMVGS